MSFATGLDPISLRTSWINLNQARLCTSFYSTALQISDNVSCLSQIASPVREGSASNSAFIHRVISLPSRHHASFDIICIHAELTILVYAGVAYWSTQLILVGPIAQCNALQTLHLTLCILCNCNVWILWTCPMSWMFWILQQIHSKRQNVVHTFTSNNSAGLHYFKINGIFISRNGFWKQLRRLQSKATTNIRERGWIRSLSRSGLLEKEARTIMNSQLNNT